MSETKLTCCESIHHAWRQTHFCGKPAKVTRAGKPYCGIHDPERATQRREARNAIWDKRQETQKRAADRGEAFRDIANEAIHQVEHGLNWPALVAAVAKWRALP